MRFRKSAGNLVLATLVTALCVTLALAAEGDGSTKPTLKSVGELLVCQCGCNYGLNYCTHNNCSSDEEISAFIQKEISEGKDQPAILKALVDRYGMKILASPPAEGFNLAAWILPGLGLVAGLVVVTLVVRPLRRPPAAGAAAPVGYVAVGTIFGAVSANTRMREVMLPVLQFPVAVPVFIGAIEASSGALRGLAGSGRVRELAAAPGSV